MPVVAAIVHCFGNWENLLLMSIAVLGVMLASTWVYFLKSGDHLLPYLPIVGKDPSESIAKAQRRWVTDAERILFSGAKKLGTPFQVIYNTGPMVIAPASFMEDIRKDESLTFKAFLKTHFFTTYPGFEGFAPATGPVFADSVRLGLIQTLGRITERLVPVASELLDDLFPRDNKDWQEVYFEVDAAKIIARLAGCAFLPTELSSDPKWLQLSVEYTLNFFTAAYTFRLLAKPLRFMFAAWIPAVRRTRRDMQSMHNLLAPVVRTRAVAREVAIREGKPAPKYNDAMGWMETVSAQKGEPINLSHGMLNYILGAVHTTSVSLVQVFYDLLEHPECLEMLRAEVISVVEADGWTKNSLQKMKLLDSTMKETMRLHPPTLLPVLRIAEDDAILTDGTKIPKGTTLSISPTSMVDPEVYPDPHTFDGERFLKLRQQPGNEALHQFVSTSNTFTPFGHGKHACPGRFFASNEIKIILALMIVRYDWKFSGSVRPATISVGVDKVFNHSAKLLYKVRDNIPPTFERFSQSLLE